MEEKAICNLIFNVITNNIWTIDLINEVNCPNILSNNNYRVSSQKHKQLLFNIWNYILSNLMSCQNFWDEAWWFLSLRNFGLWSSSWLLFPQHFGWYVFRPSSGVWSNLGTYMELQTTSFIESMGVAFSDSVCHNQVQLSIPVLLLTCIQDWTCNLQMIVSLEA